jgi:hypothetical protein
MRVQESAPLQPHSAAEFGELVQGLEAMLTELVACEVYARGRGRQPPPKTHGVYLFTEVANEEQEHLYVGRVYVFRGSVQGFRGWWA